VRRTDYKNWMTIMVEGFLASRAFYSKAMDLFRSKYNCEEAEVIFVMASDDERWSVEMFSNEFDVFFTSEANTRFSYRQPTFDLAVMSLCDHSIFRYI
jgi:hypothetical protein